MHRSVIRNSLWHVFCSIGKVEVEEQTEYQLEIYSSEGYDKRGLHQGVYLFGAFPAAPRWRSFKYVNLGTYRIQASPSLER
jgi:hypothetical protein